MTRKDARHLITDSLTDTATKAFQENRWGERHVSFWRRVRGGQVQGIATHYKGAAIVLMLEGWAAYADKHFELYESVIGDDGVLGAAWSQIGRGIKALLDGETGDLDCGTVDGLIREIASSNGDDGDTY